MIQDHRPEGVREFIGLVGSYHRDGVVDKAVESVLAGVRDAGGVTRKIVLQDRHIEFCTNCRECCRVPGRSRGHCILNDGLEALLTELESADGLVLGASVNFGDVNALTRRLLERMIGYAHWPAGQAAPKIRNPTATTAAVLVTSSAAPAILTRLARRPLRTLRMMAKLLGAKPCGSLVVGLADRAAEALPAATTARGKRLGRRLARCSPRHALQREQIGAKASHGIQSEADRVEPVLRD